MKRKYQILIFLSVAIIFLDQWSKNVILSKFQLGESISVVSSFFNITYVRNTGAAFGFLATAHSAFRVPFFIIVPLVALLIIGLMFRRLPDREVLMSSALALVMGGAVGNLIDRVQHGFVVDFLDFHWKYSAHFPAFNVADSAICVGVGLMMLDAAKKEGKSPHVSSAV
jgi:signal peptidase II